MEGRIDSSLLIGLIGALASIFGLVVAFVQTKRMWKLKRQTNADNWMTIRELLSIIRWTHPENRTSKLKNDPSIEKIFSKSISIYRQLIKQAALAEKDFDEDMIISWKIQGKIDEDWEMNEFRKYLNHKTFSSNLDKSKMRSRSEFAMVNSDKPSLLCSESINMKSLNIYMKN